MKSHSFIRPPVRWLALALALLAAARPAQAQTTNTIGSTTLTSGAALTIPAGTVTLATGTLDFTANGTATYSGINGPGTLQLGSPTNGPTSADIYFNNNDVDNTTANWGSAINAPVNLGTAQRYIFGKSNHSGAGEYGLYSTDCEMLGSIFGSGGITYIAQDSYTGSNPMEVPLALDAANSFTGPLIIQRGSVYLGVANAFPAGNTLQFTVPAGQNGKLFLWGNSATVANLSSTSAGNAVIANSNRDPGTNAPATLTILENSPTTYSGSLYDSNIEYSVTGSGNPALSVIKSGPATLTLTGTNKFTGNLDVSAGKLYMNEVTNIAVGFVTVSNGATLGGSSYVTTNVMVANGGTLEAGGGAGTGTLTMKGLALGAVSADALTLNFTGTAAGVPTALTVTGAGALANNGTTTLNISGTLPATTPAVYTLLTYAGGISGGGAFVLGTIPSFQSTAYLYNNTAAGIIQLVIPGSSVTWVGAPANDWDLTGASDWVTSGTATPASFANGNIAVFDDTASTFAVNLAAQVQPFMVSFSNVVNNYTFTGSGAITNAYNIVKQGAAAVTFSGTNLNFTNLAVNAGTVYLNTTNAAGGPLLVNNGATLAGSGFVTAPVTVANHGALVAGNAAGTGNLNLKSLTLGAVATDALTLNLASTSAGFTGIFAVTNASGVTNNGVTTVNITGTLPAVAPTTYNLLTYAGTVKGSGTFVLGAVPSSISTPYLTNNVSALAIQLVIPPPSLTWVGSPANDWDLTGSSVWKQTYAGTAASFINGSPVVFDDTAASFNVNLAAAVQPASVVFSNSVNNYTFTNSGVLTNVASLTKTGAASVTFAGPKLVVTTLSVNAGQLYLNTTNTGTTVVVNNGGTLGGAGLVSAPVTVANGGALVAGNANGSGILAMKSLALGVTGADALTLNLNSTAAGPASTFTVTTSSGLTNNGTTTINIAGALPTNNPATYNLLTYTGTAKGGGTFVMGAYPGGTPTPYVTNNPAALAIQLVVPIFVAHSLTWVGTPTNDWDLAGSVDWALTGSATPASYIDASPVVFDDSASNFVVNVDGPVQPYTVAFTNIVNNYTITGAGGISGPTPLVKQGAATLTLATTNSYTGNTTVGAGTLSLATAAALPGGPTAGNVAVNGTLDLAGNSPVVNNLSGSGIVDDLSAGGSPVITVSNSANSAFTGTIQNSSGSVALAKTGAGTLTLAAGNTYNGGTTIANGAISIAGADGLGSGPVNITENAAGGASNILTVATIGAVALTNNLILPNTAGTYILTKSKGAGLTLAGTVSGGGAGVILRTTTDTAGDTNTVTEFAGTNTFAGGLQTFRGVVQIDNPSSLGGATVYGDANASVAGDLSFAAGMNFTNPVVLQSATTFSPNTNTVVMSGPISGGFNMTKYGSGTLIFAGANSYSSLLTVNAGTLGIGPVILAADTTGPAPAVNTISIAAGATVLSSGTLTMDASASLNPSICVTGAGTLALTATNNSASSPDINFDDSDTVGSTANWGTRIATPVNLGNAQRFIWGKTDHNGIDEYGVTEGDCQFAGTISGAGGLTFVAQDSFASASQPMETPFCLNAANNFTGPVQIQRGSVYLGLAGAYPAGDVLQFNVAAGNLGKFFLHGENATVSDLSSTGAGTAVIADGNRNPSGVGSATLTIIQNNAEIYFGSIVDTNLEYPGTAVGSSTVLSVVKTGPATLTLAGNNSFSGPLTVAAGTLYLNGASTGGGLVTVSNGATLGGVGMITAAVTVSNGAALEAGAGTGSGIFSVNSLTLGAQVSDAITLNCDANPAGVDSVSVLNANGLVVNGTVTVNVTGVLPASAPAVYTLVSYAGAVQGAGSFVLGAVPDAAVAYLTNNPSASAIQLVVSSVTIPSVTWVGSPTNDWDLLGGLDWASTGTGIPAAYADFDQVVFDDTATNFLVNLASAVSPNGVLFTNNVNNYVVMGAGGISGYTALTKAGTGTVTLLTTNNYSGPTTVSAGTLAFGGPGAIPGGPGAGNVTVNGTVDLGGFSPTLNNLSGSGVVDNLTAGGSLVMTVSNTISTLFTGAIQDASGSLELNTAGSGTLILAGNNTYSGVTAISGAGLQVGNGGATGTLGAGPVLDQTTLVFDRADTNTIPNNIAGAGSVQQNGTGAVTLSGNLTYTGPTLANAGTTVFPKDVTFDAGVGSILNVAANAVVDTGFEIFLNGNASATAIDISGAGLVRFISSFDHVEDYADMIIGANNNGVSTANYGIRMAAALDLGTTNRLFWAYSSRDDVTTYGLNGCDCQFNGPFYGASKLTLLGQNSWPGVNTMEEQFAFNASNSWTGTLEVQRGSVYVGNSNAFNGNVLVLDPGASVNSRLFLHGLNAAVADLQSAGFGGALIANGNNVTSSNVGPATLTVTENNPTTFAGNILDWYTEYTAPATGPLTPTLNLVKNGPATLTLTGNNSYSGTTVINAGQVNLYGNSTGGGAVTVNTNATLSGAGLLNSAVTVENGGVIITGSGFGAGNLQVKSLALGAGNGDTSVLNLTPLANLNVTNKNGLVLNGGAGSVTVNISGDIAAAGTVPLITYAGALGGTGFGAFQLGSAPAGVLGYLSNDTAQATIDFVATLVTVPRWSGALSTAWTTNVLALPKNWVLNSDGVTPIDYVDGENVIFDDTATNPVVNISAATVSPGSVTISNNVQNYVFNGAHGIAAAANLTKLGSGQVVLGTVNTYPGSTLISAGTLTLGAAGAIPGGSGAGNVTVNGTLDLGGFSPTLNNLSGTGIVDDLSAGGSPVVTVDETAGSTFAGVIQNTTGSAGLTLTGPGTLTLNNTNTYSGPTLVSSGTLLVNGSLGASPVTVQGGAALGGTGAINGFATLNTGAALDLTASTPLTAGTLTLKGAVTVFVSGPVVVTNSGSYVLCNYRGINVTNLFQLGPVAGILNSGFTATLGVTTNQLVLNIGPTLPTGTIADVKHVVIFMQENRSFDHYFGSLHGVHGFSDHITLTQTNGSSILYQPSGSSYELPFHTTTTCLSDLDHSWSVTHNAWNNGLWNDWPGAKGTETMAYYQRADVPYYYALADNFTICDEYHCGVMSSTDPNRVTHWTGMIDPTDLGGGPLIDNTEPTAGWGTNWTTYPELLQKAGVSWRVFQASDNYDDNALFWFAAYKNAPVGSPLNVNGTQFAPSIQSGTGFPADYTNLMAEFKGYVTSNTLPAVSWVIGPDVGSEHPSWSAGDGEIITKGLLDALASNPKIYNNTVFILNFDENDGFFDHAVPINPPAGTANEFVSSLPIGLGVRVPCIIVSPWTQGGHVCSQVFDHTSILRFLEKWTGVFEPNISAWRRAVCGDLTSAFDFAHPNTNYPSLAAATENDCPSGTTATPPGTQTVPVQESGTLIARPLPYQPNALAALDCTLGNCNIIMTNSGAASMHFSVYANKYVSPTPTPCDVSPSNTVTGSYSTLTTSGNYDFSVYSANGFLRRFAGNVKSDCGQVDSLAYLNPGNDGFEITLANPSGAAVTFSVTNGWFANSLATYNVPAGTTNVVFLDTSTNTGWYDLQVTASSDPLFVRRFAGHIETNTPPAALLSSENPSGYKDMVMFTANFAGFGTPTGTAQFMTNGVAFGAPVALNNGVASFSTALLPRTNNVVAVAYSGDILNPPVTNSITQTVLDHPPVPATVVYQRAAGQSFAISISDLLTNVTDVDGDAITLVGVGTDGLNLLTTNGVTLTTNASFIIYTNSVTPNVNDSFEYTVSDGFGGVSLGTVQIVVNTNFVVSTNASLIVSSTNATVNFFGAPGTQYEIDRSTNLTPGVGEGWVPISTNVAPVSGIIQVNDAFMDLGIQPPAPPSAFYRLRPNP